MQHIMPHERPTPEDTGRIFDNRAAVPALCWAIALGLIVVSGWMDSLAGIEAVPLVAAQTAASQATPTR
jgi:hypothetical protein